MIRRGARHRAYAGEQVWWQEFVSAGFNENLRLNVNLSSISNLVRFPMWSECVFCLSFSTLIEFSSIKISLSCLVETKSLRNNKSKSDVRSLIVVNLRQIVQQKFMHKFGDFILFLDRVANLFSFGYLLPPLLVEIWLLFNSIEFRNDTLNHK